MARVAPGLWHRTPVWEALVRKSECNQISAVGHLWSLPPLSTFRGNSRAKLICFSFVNYSQLSLHSFCCLALPAPLCCCLFLSGLFFSALCCPSLPTKTFLLAQILEIACCNELLPECSLVEQDVLLCAGWKHWSFSFYLLSFHSLKILTYVTF